MKKRRYFSGGGVPTTGGMYNTAPVQYPFPSDGGGLGPPPSSNSANTTVNVNGQEVVSEADDNPFGPSEESGPLNLRKGGRVKSKSHSKSHSKSKPKSKSSRGDGIAQRGRTRGRML